MRAAFCVCFGQRRRLVLAGCRRRLLAGRALPAPATQQSPRHVELIRRADPLEDGRQLCPLRSCESQSGRTRGSGASWRECGAMAADGRCAEMPRVFGWQCSIAWLVHVLCILCAVLASADTRIACAGRRASLHSSREGTVGAACTLLCCSAVRLYVPCGCETIPPSILLPSSFHLPSSLLAPRPPSSVRARTSPCPRTRRTRIPALQTRTPSSPLKPTVCPSTPVANPECAPPNSDPLIVGCAVIVAHRRRAVWLWLTTLVVDGS